MSKPLLHSSDTGPAPANAPSLLVVGCGDLGGGVASVCAAAGWRVWGLRRRPVELAGVEPIAADVTDPTSLQPLAELQPDFVLLALTPGGYTDERYAAVYVEGLRNCLAALNRDRLRRLLWISSTSVYHQNDGGWVDESSPAQPSGFAGRRLLEAESLLAETGLPHTVLRLGGIYGPGRDRLLRQLRSGVRSPEQPVRYSNRIHRDDAVGAATWLLQRAERGDSLESLYLGVDAEPAPIVEVERWFAAELGLDHAHMREDDGELRGGNRRCSSARLQATGYRFRYPSYREGLPTLLRSNGDPVAGE